MTIHKGELAAIIIIGAGIINFIADIVIGFYILRMRLIQASKLLGIVSLYAGIVLLIAASILGWIAHEKFKKEITNSDEIKHLIKDGVYKHVRHPFYLSLIVIGLALILILDSYLTTAAFVVVSIMLLFEARKEEQVLIKKFGNEYLHYCKVTGMFFPKVIRR